MAISGRRQPFKPIIKTIPITPVLFPFNIPSQRFDTLPNNDYNYWEQFKNIPIITEIGIPLNITSQRFDNLPELNTWWEQSINLPISITPSIRSTSIATAQSGSTFTVPLPPGTVNGDILIYFQSTALAGGAIVTPVGGWTNVVHINFGSGYAQLACYFKIAFNEGANYTFNNSIGGLGSKSTVRIICFENASGIDYVNSIGLGNGTSATCNITTTHNNELIIAGIAIGSNAGTTITPDSTLTDLGTLADSSVSLNCAWNIRSIPGAGSQSAALSGTVDWCEILVGIKPILLTITPNIFNIPSQRFDTLPNNDYNYWEQFKNESIPVGFIKLFPNPSQRIDILPDYNFVHWKVNQYNTILPNTFLFPLYAPSQRIDTLPELYTWWEQFTLHPPTRHDIPPFNYSQRFDTLPNYEFTECEILRHTPIPVSFIPNKPPTHQPSQRFDNLPVYFNYSSWQPRNLQTIVNIPDISTSGQPSQRWDALPDYFDFGPWQPVTKRLPPSGFMVGCFGAYGYFINIVSNTYLQGSYTIANDSLVGYNIYIYIGIGTQPDFTTPTDFTNSLPYSIPYALPVSGNTILNIVTRSQDQFGLESVNQYATVITLTPTSVLLEALQPPQNTNAVFIPSNLGVRITAQYPNAFTDTSPATSWYVYISESVLVPGVDTPTQIVPVAGMSLLSNIFPISAGIYNVIVGLFRLADGALVTGSTIQVTVPNNPIIPKAVLSGFESPQA